MTNEEIEQAYHQEMKARLFTRGHSEMNNPLLAREIFLKWLTIGKREAVEKTKRACWGWLTSQDYTHDDEDKREALYIDVSLYKCDFERVLTPDKILSQSEKEGEG